MIGLERLANLRECCTRVIEDGIPGDFCETGVWRGGACIYMRGILRAFDEPSKLVWVCDSFEGLPKPSHPGDMEIDESGGLNQTAQLWRHKSLAVSIEQVKANFARYGLLDDRVRFLKGWFRDSLPTAPVKSLSVLRLDGDLYESTWDAIVNLYPKLTTGGFLIVDDYGMIPQCRKAIHDYRDQQGITDPIKTIDSSGIFWRKSR
jgi:O-methyltransferase